MLGGYTKTNPANEHVQGIVDKLKDQILAHSIKRNYPNLTAISYKSQVVAGTNYHIKVDAEGEDVHVKVFEPLPHTNAPHELKEVQFGKSRSDEL